MLIRKIWSGLLLVGLLASGYPSLAQSPQPITADTIETLTSLHHFDFELVSSRGLSPASGLFVMSADASLIVSFANADEQPPLSTAVLWDGNSGELLKAVSLGDTHFERQLSPDGQTLIYATATDLLQIDLVTETITTAVESETPFLSVWFSENGSICGEMSPDPMADITVICSDGREIELFQNKEDFVRIGRVPPPLAVTVTDTGLVSRWDMETGEITAQVEAGGIAVFGAVNISGSVASPESGTHLAWRDPPSENLYWLDFATEDNRLITPLESGFIAHILLSPQADIILAVDPMAARGQVWAWDVNTQTQYELGNFRPCERQQPDLARFSLDGTALVIGCDLGLDIWRVQ